MISINVLFLISKLTEFFQFFLVYAKKEVLLKFNVFKVLIKFLTAQFTQVLTSTEKTFMADDIDLNFKVNISTKCP